MPSADCYECHHWRMGGLLGWVVAGFALCACAILVGVLIHGRRRARDTKIKLLTLLANRKGSPAAADLLKLQ